MLPAGCAYPELTPTELVNTIPVYLAKPAECGNCPVRKRCTPGPYRKVSLHWREPARQATRDLVSIRAGTEQDRSAVFRAQTAGGIGQGPSSPTWERDEAVLPRRHRPKPQTVGQVS